MIDSQKVLYNKVGNDENYTPDYGVKPIIKHLIAYAKDIGYSSNIVVWCPFDTIESEFVKQLNSLDFVEVVYSHIDEGQDFFNYEPEYWDVIISNPPFKGKRQFFERALSFNKPFALLMTLACFNDKYPAWSFYEQNKELQLLKFDKRIKFSNPDGRPNNKITFQSGYMCYNFLKSNLILEELVV